jgi:uncharacterized protein YijF (DUF1287 family)
MKNKQNRKIKWRNLLIVIVVPIIGLTLLGFGYQTVFPISYSNEYFDIEDYISDVDKDQDGVDNQSDILDNVREYIKTRPTYKSKYYAGGYSDDEFGVCTDVIAVGLLGAGYDLMHLVHQDILDNRTAYQVDTVDENIDFKRVVNLRVYFERHAIKLTNDIYDIEQWQGGDIIVFEKHIGIVSDKRNKNGVPFIIHHASSFQIKYEEDILENMAEVVGHYRIS